MHAVQLFHVSNLFCCLYYSKHTLFCDFLRTLGSNTVSKYSTLVKTARHYLKKSNKSIVMTENNMMKDDS